MRAVCGARMMQLFHSVSLWTVAWSMIFACVASNFVLDIDCGKTDDDPGFDLPNNMIPGSRKKYGNGRTTIIGVDGDKFQRFRTYRRTLPGYDDFTYELTGIPSGPATLTLEFVEYKQSICSIGDGGRIFSVEVDGVVVLADFDVFVAGGRICRTAVTEVFPVVVSGGSMSVKFIRGIGDAMVSGMKIESEVPFGMTTVPSVTSSTSVLPLTTTVTPETVTATSITATVGPTTTTADPTTAILESTSTTMGPPTMSVEATTTTANPTTTTRVSISSPAPVDDGCGGLGNIVRKNVRSMTQREWDDYLTAFNTVINTMEPGGSGRNIYEQFARDHTVHAFHENEYFLAWHRQMLWKLDVALNAAVPGVTQPYFDWSVSADNIFEDPMFLANRFGGSVAETGEAESPIPNGPWLGLQSSWPAPHSVTRNFNNDPLATPGLIDSIVLGISTFDEFTLALEFGIHNAFHRAIGGDMVTPWSPNEPLFYFHHAFIDLIYRKWENRGSVDTSSVADPQLPMAPWIESTAESTEGSAKRCVSYEGLDSSASRLAILGRQTAEETNTKFATASEKVEALAVVAKKKVSDPDGYKKDAIRWQKARDAAKEAAKILNRDPEKLSKAEDIISTLLLKYEAIDMAEVDRVANESVAEVRAEGFDELSKLKSGNLPDDFSTADVANVDE